MQSTGPADAHCDTYIELRPSHVLPALPPLLYVGDTRLGAPAAHVLRRVEQAELDAVTGEANVVTAPGSAGDTADSHGGVIRSWRSDSYFGLLWTSWQ